MAGGVGGAWRWGPPIRAILAPAQRHHERRGIKITEQGEVAGVEVFLPGWRLQLETMTTAVLQNSLVSTSLDEQPKLEQSWMAPDGRQLNVWQLTANVVTTIPDLGRFFQQVTTRSRRSAKLQISSRPARRKSGAKDLSSLREFPLGVRAGRQSPLSCCRVGWGWGAALQEETPTVTRASWSLLAAWLYQRWPFFLGC